MRIRREFFGRTFELFAVFAFLLCAFPVRGATFDAANQLYDEGRFSEAKTEYDRLVLAKQWSANLFHNLGNANYRLGAPGVAILDYERALALDPGQPEAQANLAFLRGQTGAVLWPRSWIDQLFPGRMVAAYVIVAALAGWGAVFLLAAIFLSVRGDKSVLWFGAVAAALLAVYATAAVWHCEQDRLLAIVTGKVAEVHLAPAESSGQEAILPAGSQVRLLSTRGEWIYCILPSQGRGWIPAKDIERVRLGES